VPQTNVAYYHAIFCIVLITILYEGLKAARAVLEFKWKIHHQQSLQVPGERSHLMRSDEDLTKDKFATPFDCGVDLPRSFLRTLELTISYFLMLIAMSFNVGFFCAILVGAFFGTLIFGRYQFPVSTAPHSSTVNESFH